MDNKNKRISWTTKDGAIASVSINAALTEEECENIKKEIEEMVKKSPTVEDKELF